ncbi:MAG TPA: hypothetical protein VHX88_12705 [Solirubrobacteraceae bacterium]|nr:hypothetical protein [Solirubrobacteraceae bacterium]
MAALFAIGYVGFGVGSGSSGTGGALNAINSGQNGSAASFSSIVDKDKKIAQREPTNADAWGNLARAEFQLAGQGSDYNTSTGTFTAGAKPLLEQIKTAWQRYLALNPSHPSADLANLMSSALGEGGLNDYAGALQALQIVAQNETATYQVYTYMAYYAYKAGLTTQGNLAAQKALALVPAADRSQLQEELTALKGSTGTTGASGPAATTVPATTSTATITVPAKKPASAAEGTKAGKSKTSTSKAATSTSATKSKG